MVPGLPSLDDLIEQLHVVSIPLRHTFRGTEHRETMLFEGDNSPAEWAPFPEYDDAEAAWWLASAIEQGFSRDFPAIPSHIAEIRVNAIIPAIDPPDVPALLGRFAGVKSVKIKVAEPGRTPIDDLTRIAAVRKGVGPDVTIRLDANGAWEVAEAERNLFMFSAFNIDYIEQPVGSLDEMARLRVRLRGTGIRLAADESLRKGGDITRILEAEAADLVILKVNPLGGIKRCLDLARTAREGGVGVVVSSGLETSVGIAHGAHLHALLADSVPDTEDAGLGSAALFAGDVVTQPLTPSRGAIRLLMPVLDPRKLKKFRAGDDSHRWWVERLRRVYDRLGDVATQKSQ